MKAAYIDLNKVKILINDKTDTITYAVALIEAEIRQEQENELLS